ncbi:MAG: DUF1846 domain-containing protein [Candidatus Omnitrophica bacterium]|nr:DUF1846 domain-containing protein [Candidatus Omnitrophota bacterium]
MNENNPIGFDNEKYLKEQGAAILERVEKFNGKLYLEFGGKLLFDYHAARVLPGYDPNVKIRLLQQLKNKLDIILCIYAGDIEKGRMRGDFGITYDVDALKIIDDLRRKKIDILAVVITRFDNQPQAIKFKNKLEHRNIKVYTHQATKGYPTDVDLIVSEDGYGRNAYIETKSPLVIVTGPGPGSGKLATCLSQLYHDYKRGVRSGYAKFETFPIWNLPLEHPINIAYEAATADIADFNLIDPFHLNTYNQSSVNYNRDVETFPVLKRILEKITSSELVYNSPTDMGVNRAGFAIVDDDTTKEAARQEIIRRYFRYKYEKILGIEKEETVERVNLLMEGMNLKQEDRSVVVPARKAAEEAQKKNKHMESIGCGASIELKDGRIITGKNSSLMHAASAAVFNAIKALAEIPEKIHLLSPKVIEHIGNLKKDILGLKSECLDLEEILIALSISAATNPTAEMAMKKLQELQGCQAHITHIPTPGDETGLRRLRINLTADANFPSSDLYIV